MDFEHLSIGTDIERVSRFSQKTLENSAKFFEKIYTKCELDYCFSKSNPAQHLAGRYCSKEAVVKALTDLGITKIGYSDIEIINAFDKHPVVKIEKYPNVKVKLSLSHTGDYATATAIAYYE